MKSDPLKKYSDRIRDANKPPVPKFSKVKSEMVKEDRSPQIVKPSRSKDGRGSAIRASDNKVSPKRASEPKPKGSKSEIKDALN